MMVRNRKYVKNQYVDYLSPRKYREIGTLREEGFEVDWDKGNIFVITKEEYYREEDKCRKIRCVCLFGKYFSTHKNFEVIEQLHKEDEPIVEYLEEEQTSLTRPLSFLQDT
jgi:hypothetical protein